MSFVVPGMGRNAKRNEIRRVRICRRNHSLRIYKFEEIAMGSDGKRFVRVHAWL